jgi:endoglycosylceramidase
MNAIYKVHPYIPVTDRFDINDSIESEVDIPILEIWGMNLMRLGVMWEAVETGPGVYNATYLDEIETLLYKMGEKGIYTMVDAHQDVMARITCGEGMPDFYAREVSQGAQCSGDWSQPEFDGIKENFGECKSMDEYGYERDENDWPLISECNKQAFWKYYTSSETLAIFDALYTNKFGLTDKFVAYWDTVAKRFSKN